MYVFDVTSGAKWGDKLTGTSQADALKRLQGLADAPAKVKDVLTKSGFVEPCMICGANLFGQVNVCTNGECGCTPTIHPELGWDGCVYANGSGVKDDDSGTCPAYQHRIYPIYAYVAAYASPFCDANQAVWVFDEHAAGTCKRNLETYIGDKVVGRSCHGPTCVCPSSGDISVAGFGFGVDLNGYTPKACNPPPCVAPGCVDCASNPAACVGVETPPEPVCPCETWGPPIDASPPPGSM